LKEPRAIACGTAGGVKEQWAQAQCQLVYSPETIQTLMGLSRAEILALQTESTTRH
jgi:hypothetical protein